MADASNAVMASNGDFYIFRNMGINVYRGTLYRCNPGLDTCFIDSDGNLRCFTSDEMNTQEEVEAFVKDNGVSFSLSFGPVLVRDGEAFDIGKYPVGEYYAPNIRSVIGQKGDKHYLLMLTGSAMLEMIQERMMQYGCDTVYCLDGGQTGEHRFNGERLNQIMFRGERNVSDIIYFATAMPEDSYWN